MMYIKMISNQYLLFWVRVSHSLRPLSQPQSFPLSDTPPLCSTSAGGRSYSHQKQTEEIKPIQWGYLYEEGGGGLWFIIFIKLYQINWTKLEIWLKTKLLSIGFDDRTGKL